MSLTHAGDACHKGVRRFCGMPERYVITEIFREIFRLPHLTVFPGLKSGDGVVYFSAAALMLALFTAFSAPVAAKETAPTTQLLPPKGAANVPQKRAIGPESRLPVPRFVSLKSGRINVRRGPGPDNEILWVFAKKGLPVEVTAESGRWRRIRDREGDVGWVWHSMLDGRRTALIEGHAGDTTPVAMHVDPDASSNVVAYAEPGVIAQVRACAGEWCELQASGYEGWVQRQNFWGTYWGEDFE